MSDVVHSRRPHHVAAAVLGWLVATGAAAAPGPTVTGASLPVMSMVTVAQLKSAYLDCSREAEAGLLDRGGVMGCSMVCEALKQRAFGGDFARVLAWSQAQDTTPRDIAAAEAGAGRTGR